MSSTKTALVPLAPGFEETEAVTIIDVLRRAEIEVVVAGLEARPIKGAHGITLVPDTTLDEASETTYDAIVLPGGMPGAERLKTDEGVQALLAGHHERGALVAAICAAPMALAPKGITHGRTMTCFPGFEKHLAEAHFVEHRVVVDGRVVTSRGPGTALEFALTLVALLVGDDTASRLSEQMIVHRPEAAHVAG